MQRCTAKTGNAYLTGSLRSALFQESIRASYRHGFWPMAHKVPPNLGSRLTASQYVSIAPGRSPLCYTAEKSETLGLKDSEHRHLPNPAKRYAVRMPRSGHRAPVRSLNSCTGAQDDPLRLWAETS